MQFVDRRRDFGKGVVRPGAARLRETRGRIAALRGIWTGSEKFLAIKSFAWKRRTAIHSVAFALPLKPVARPTTTNINPIEQ
jgi:hypothetical protein